MIKKDKKYYHEQYLKRKNKVNWVEKSKKWSDSARSKPHNILTRYKLDARDRNIYFDLSLIDMEKIEKQKICHYCGSELDFIRIDRVNNELGYISNNIVPCCKICNYMKGKMKKDLFLQQCIKIISYQKINK